jgi:hypothetical protein
MLRVQKFKASRSRFNAARSMLRVEKFNAARSRFNAARSMLRDQRFKDCDVQYCGV